MENKEKDVLRKMLNSLFQDRQNETVKKNVFIISGPPGSGKTDYVFKHKEDNDLVVDLDYICAALNASQELYQNHEYVLGLALQLQEVIYKAIEKNEGKWKNAYVITATPDKAEVEEIVNRLNGQLIIIDATLEECIDNILKDERRVDSAEKFIYLAKQWFEKREI